MTPEIFCTAWRNTSRPFMRRWPGGLGGAGAAVDVEQVLEAAVRADAGGQDAAVVAAAELRLRLQHDRAGAVAEQHAGAAVLPVEDAREGLGADHDGALELAGLEEIVGDGQGVDEARADRLHVEGGALGDAEAGLDAHGGGRKGAVRRGGGADDEIDVDRVDAGAHQRLARGGDAEIGGQLALLGDVALLDAGALA